MDLKKCVQLQTPNVDPQVVKTLNRIEQQLQEEKAKTKKMYGKMFG